MNPPILPVRGLPFVDLDADGLVRLLSERLHNGPPTAVFTPNATIGAACLANESYRSLVLTGDILLPDGIGVILASRREHPGGGLRCRLPGIEAGEAAMALAAEGGEAVFFLGGKPGVADAAAQYWKKQYPTLRIAGTQHGYFDRQGQENERILARIAAGNSALVIVCLGFPSQEEWITENRNRLPGVRLWMGLGGSLDVWSGQVRRAPRLFRACRAEWLWRCLKTPSRMAALPDMLRYTLVRGKERRPTGENS